MKLVIVESPNKCATISSFMGKDYKVLASKGNVRDLATSGKGGLGVDVTNNFKTTYKVDPGKYSVVKELSEEAKKSEEVILATDPDREGEAISWHLAQLLKLDPKTTKRILFHEITAPAIKEALENPSTINMNLVDSQETRRIYDRVIGFKLSKLVKKQKGCDSAGRVQSASLKMIVDNDRERKAFVPKEYWEIFANIEVNEKSLEIKLIKDKGENIKISSKEEADQIISRIGSNIKLTSIKNETKHISAKAPLITSTLNQEAFNKFGLPVSRTTSIAQKLYEGLEINGQHIALITYIRTDLAAISPVFYNEQAKPYILNEYGKEYLGSNRNAKMAANTQGAHEAIRPVDLKFTPEKAEKYLNSDEAKIYKLIYERAIESLMTAKVIETSTAYFEGNDFTFSVSGSKTIFPGYTKAITTKEDEESKELPNLSENSEYKIIDTKPTQKFTQPPAAISEAKLVKLMEQAGIGRPSTYSSTIYLLKKRKYVITEKGFLVPTNDGYKSVEFLEKYFSNIVNANYTAEMESKLDEIEDGKVSKVQALTDFYFPFDEEFNKVVEYLKNNPETPDPKGICPVCGSILIERKSKYGTFIACSNFPKCNYIKKEEKTAPKLTGEMCPECGKPLVERTSKGKTFVACSGFPKCRYIKGQESKKYTEADYIKPCPKCGSGFIVKKISKKGEFYACTNYPKCKYHEFPKSAKKSEK